MIEVWKDVEGYEGLYKVSNRGRVLSCQKTVIRSNGRPISFPEKIMTPAKNHKGYLIIDLRKNGSRKGGLVHRLVALAFIDNPEHKEQVNHKDGNKENNCVRNLEWATNSENQIHSYSVLQKTNEGAAKSRRRKVEQLDEEGKVINIFNSIKEAQNFTKIHNISAVCRGVRADAGGFVWRYSTETGVIALSADKLNFIDLFAGI